MIVEILYETDLVILVRIGEWEALIGKANFSSIVKRNDPHEVIGWGTYVDCNRSLSEVCLQSALGDTIVDWYNKRGVL